MQMSNSRVSRQLRTSGHFDLAVLRQALDRQKARWGTPGCAEPILPMK
jgi:hypothetical protein